MPKSTTDRNLLFGILALQMDFIARDALIVAMNAWVLKKSKPLGEILLEQKALTPDTHALLDALVQKHLALHGNDAEKSLAAVSSAGSLRNHLEQIADADVQASLMHVSADPYAATASYVGTTTSSGLRFRILRPHKKGGLGEVYVAHDEELHREVALKEIQDRHADNQDSRSRFLLEAEITGGLEHPCIVPVYGLGQYADGRPFYAMRFIRGDSLQDAIKKHHQTQGPAGPALSEGERTLQLRQLLGRFIDVCQAIQYAHDRGVLHRDLKPGNIMLGKYGETLVVDWGLAKASGEWRGARGVPAGREAEARARESIEPTLHPMAASGVTPTMLGAALGTPQYMSPEQAAGRLDELGPTSDVYSLGATLYCLLTGKAPVENKDIATVLEKVQKAEFPRPRQLKPGVDPALDAICMKAMALKPTDRFFSPRALADDIEHWLADEPATAYPEPWTGRARRWLKRHRAAVLAAVAVLAVAAVSLAVATALLSAKNEELTRANTREQAAKLQEQAAREQAQKNFQMAFQAVEDYLTGVADNDRLREKDLEPLRRDLFRSAQTFYQRFAEQERDSPKYRSLAAQADIALGQVHGQLGEREQAKAHYAKAVTALQALVTAEPDQFPHSERLVRATLEMADLLRRMKDAAASETWARDGVRLSRQLRNDFSGERTPPKHEVWAHLSLGDALTEGLRLPEAEKEIIKALRLQEGPAKAADGWQGTLALVQVHVKLGNLYEFWMGRSADAEKSLRAALGLLDGLDEATRAKPRVRSQWAVCQHGLANGLVRQGRSQEGEQGHRAAVRAYERLAAEFPMIPSHREGLDNALGSLSICLAVQGQGRAKENRDVVRQRIAVAEKLVHDFPGIHSYRWGLAIGHYDLGRVQNQLGEKEESERQRRKSVEIMAALVKELPDVPEYTTTFSSHHNGLGFALQRLGRFEESRAEIAKALELSRPLAAKHPGVPEYQLHYALALENYSEALVLASKTEEALTHAQDAVAVLEKLTVTSPKNVEYRMYLGSTYGQLAQTQQACGQPSKARQTVDRGVRMLEEVLLKDAKLAEAKQWLTGVHEVRVKLLAGLNLDAAEVKDGQRALSLAHAGKVDDAAKEADTLAAGAELPGEGCYTLARVYAVLATGRKKDDGKGRERDADCALAMLRRACAAGYFQDAARLERLQREPDLAPLHDRADFQELSRGAK